MSDVRVTVSDGLATILLNRPQQLNAFTDAMEAGLIDAFDRCDADDEVRAVILTGAGRAFCAGLDLDHAADTLAVWRDSPTAPPDTTYDVPGHDLPVRRDGGGRVVLRIFESLKPVIAAVNGPAVGVGATMILACDLRLASVSARFGYVFTRLGVVPESCSSWFLPRVVPIQTALEWTLTGRVFPASEALEAGLVRSLHEPGDLLPAANALAREIADNAAPVSAALSRQLLWRMQGATHPMTAHQAETLALNVRGVSRDAREGFGAFVAKRPAAFPDRVSHDLPDIFGAQRAPTFDPGQLEDRRET